MDGYAPRKSQASSSPMSFTCGGKCWCSSTSALAVTYFGVQLLGATAVHITAAPGWQSARLACNAHSSWWFNSVLSSDLHIGLIDRSCPDTTLKNICHDASARGWFCACQAPKKIIVFAWHAADIVRYIGVPLRPFMPLDSVRSDNRSCIILDCSSETWFCNSLVASWIAEVWSKLHIDVASVLDECIFSGACCQPHS